MSENILRDLRILSLIRDGDKVYTFGGDVCLLPPGIYSAFYRWTRGDSRQKSIETVRTLLNDALLLAEDGARKGLGDMANAKVYRLFREIEGAVEGIRHMRTTYIDDASSAATLGIIREGARERLLFIGRALEPTANPSQS